LAVSPGLHQDPILPFSYDVERAGTMKDVMLQRPLRMVLYAGRYALPEGNEH
jgi:hypothetical protein